MVRGLITMNPNKAESPIGTRVIQKTTAWVIDVTLMGEPAKSAKIAPSAARITAAFASTKLIRF